MSLAVPYPARLEFRADDHHVDRWRPIVQWLLAIPHMFVMSALSSLRQALTVISFFTVLFTKSIPQSLFGAIAMTYRYEWRVASYALFLHEDYPPFDFAPSADDDGVDRHSIVTFEYPQELSRWRPFVKWLLAIPHYVVLFFLFIAAAVAVLAGFVAVIATAEYPDGLRRFLVSVYRYNLRVQAYIGLLTDAYPPFSLND